MPRVGSRLSLEEQATIKRLTFRHAKDRYHIGYQKWKAIREAKGFLAFRESRPATTRQEVEEGVIASVKALPQLNTGERAQKIGVGTGTVQDILVSRGLDRLHQRLRFAGYRVEECVPRAAARLRRVVAAYPGALTHTDYKTFGYLRPSRGKAHQPSRRIGAFLCIDSLTAYASVHLTSVEDQFEAAKALACYIDNAPFEVRGLLLSDNAKCFLSEHSLRMMGQNASVLRSGKPQGAASWKEKGNVSLS